MSNVPRVSAEEIKRAVENGSALLVCAYSNDSKFRENHLDGAIALSEFSSRVSGLDKNTQIIFYCG